MKFRITILLGVALAVMACASSAEAQGRGGRGGFGGSFGGGVSRLALLRVEAVQKELSVTPEQIAEIDKLRTELRPMRRGGNNNEAISLPDGSFFIQDGGRRQLTEEQRAEMAKQQAERSKKEREKLAMILKPEQYKRLNEIFVQAAGTAALRDDEIAAALSITEEQKTKLTKVNEEMQTAMREAFAGGGGGGDREAMRAKMEELQKSREEKTLAVLTDDQKKKLEELKGAKFDLPADALRQGGRGRGNA